MCIGLWRIIAEWRYICILFLVLTESERIYLMDAVKEFVAILIFVFVAGLFVRMIIVNVKSLISRKNTPVQSVSAEVVSKNKENGISALGPSGIRNGKSIYSVKFSAGEELEFYVTKEDFDGLNEGATGLLNYRGRTFLGFAQDALLRSDENEKN